MGQKNKKLSLNRETVRVLATNDLTLVNGGIKVALSLFGWVCWHPEDDSADPTEYVEGGILTVSISTASIATSVAVTTATPATPEISAAISSHALSESLLWSSPIMI
ncbi:MAG: hypothetical protein HJJLKODD_00407 [Phycisphaerae bacterium]|nr:hypothetical protein [Phycisphaerae bacterium]